MVMTGIVRLRNAFTIASQGSTSGHERHMITAPKHGPQRAQARRAIMAVLRRADQQRHRVSFVVTMGDYTQWELGTANGYDASSALLECRAERDDPYLWIEQQLHRGQHRVDANAIIGVGIRTWPSVNFVPMRLPR
jgi:hypothetical protein